mgnify:FL=1
MVSLQFLITSLIVVLIPGTGVIYTVSTGLTQGKKASLYVALGCTLGIVPHLLATILGLAALMHTSAVAFQILKWAGVVYLFYVAWGTWRDKSAFQLDDNPSKTHALGLISKAILMNVLNPKLTIFFLAFLPQFIPANSTHVLAPMLLLSAIFMLMTLAVFVVYGLLAHTFRHFVVESARVQTFLRYGFTAAFIGLASKLALTDK